MNKVFLGGTCNESTWRDELIKMLKIDYFNPVVDDWTEECMQEEIRQRELCDYCLYVITPRMTGVYSIAEVVDDSNKRPEKTIFCLLSRDHRKSAPIAFSQGQMKSLNQVGRLVESNGGKYFTSLQEVADYLNSRPDAPSYPVSSEVCGNCTHCSLITNTITGESFSSREMYQCNIEIEGICAEIESSKEVV